MKSFVRTGVCVAVLLLNGAARAAEVATVLPAPPQNEEQASLPPYPKDWDKRLGDDFFTRLLNYYALEWGRTEPPPEALEVGSFIGLSQRGGADKYGQYPDRSKLQSGITC